MKPVQQSLGRSGSPWSLSAIRFIATRLSFAFLFRVVLPGRISRGPLVVALGPGGRIAGPGFALRRAACRVSAIADGVGARHEPNYRSPALS